MTPEERFSMALHSTARAWRLALDARLKDLGVGQSGWMTIAIVAKSKRELSQRELADQLGVEGPSVVSMIDRLENAGLVLRSPSPTDRRVKLVHLTDSGRALYAKVKKEANAFRSSLLADVDTAALAAAADLMDALRERIEGQL
jgi:MarR family transcriptional regulator, transcriptional regulator for hemolysin